MAHQEDPDLNENGETEIDASANDDVALRPGPNADSQAEIERYISSDVRELYEVFSYRHAAAIIANSYPEELREIEAALLSFRITKRDIGMPGGNESVMPKKFSRVLRPAGWLEARIQGDLHVRVQEYSEKTFPNGQVHKIKRSESTPVIVENFIDGHKIDYVKGRVAFDLEWNSKDQTFDRDLYAMRAFHETGLISTGVMVTRSASLNPVFDVVQQLTKTGEPVVYKSGKKSDNRNRFGGNTGQAPHGWENCYTGSTQVGTGDVQF